MKKIFNLFFLLIFILLISGCWVTTENGKHNGQIIAIEKGGIIWKTYTLYIKSDISSSQEDDYCVEKEELIPKIEEASKNRNKVTLYYHDEAFIAPWRCGSEIAIVDNLEVNS